MAVKPTGEEVQLAEVFTPATSPNEATAVPVLPATASSLALIGLLGLMALCAGFTVKAVAARLS